MPARARNNPRQIRIKSCGCKPCTEQFRPGEKPTRKDCTGSWQARYRDPSGRQRAKTFSGQGAKKKAEAFLDKTRDQVRSGAFVDLDRGQITISEWYPKWQASKRHGETTKEVAQSVWTNHVQAHFGDWRLTAIGHLDVEEWVVKLTGVVGPATIEKALKMLDGMLAVAVRDRRIAYNPCDGVKTPKAPAKHPDDLMPPSYDQLAQIRSHVPEHYHPFLIVAEETGLRWGEIVNLRRCFVDFEAGTIQVRETIIHVGGLPKRKAYPKSSAGSRTVPLSARAASALKGHLEKHPASDARTAPASGMHKEELVFRGLRGAVLGRSNFWRLWTSACKSAGVSRQVENPVTKRVEWWPHVHDVRHAFASRLHAAGIPEADAQKILGHERGGKVTWLYTHASSGSVDTVRSALDGVRLRAVS
jgi:integrase